MKREKLAIDGGTPVRTEPFGPRWIFGEEERRNLMEVMDNAHHQAEYDIHVSSYQFVKRALVASKTPSDKLL